MLSVLLFFLWNMPSHAEEIFDAPHWIYLLPKDFDGRRKVYETSLKDDCRSKTARREEIEAEKRKRHSALLNAKEEWHALNPNAPAALSANDPEVAHAQKRLTGAAEDLDKAKAKENSCIAEASDKKPLEIAIAYYLTPDRKAGVAGKIWVEYKYKVSRMETSLRLQPALAVKRQPFKPDISGLANGDYRAYHTITGREGSFVRLPRDPFPQPVWIDTATAKLENPVSILDLEAPVSVKVGAERKKVRFTGIEKDDHLTGFIVENQVRCPASSDESGEDDASAPIKTISVAVKDLYDANQHNDPTFDVQDEEGACPPETKFPF
ncbi:MAG: hypothetical protein HC902_07650 [Calothrix sp. SM1_5_4]|nr:hypothetical protein [Calothrix sp. SM1_5_4]